MNDHDLVQPAASTGVSISPPKDHYSLTLLVTVLAVTFLAYLGTLKFQFVHDDRTLILQNPFLCSWRYFLHYFQAGIWPTWSAHPTDNAYRPVVLIWFRLNQFLFGFTPCWWHVSTVLAHVAATYAVYRLARKLLVEWPFALLGALIFGLHPVHIEGVAWISGVPEPLLAALLIPSYLCWVRSRETVSGSGAWLGGSLAFYSLAMLAKETAVVLPLILLVSQWLGFPRALECQPNEWISKLLRVLKGIFPFFVLTAVYLIARTMALKGFSHPAAQIGWLTVVMTWPSLLLFYLKLLVWPVGLSPFYGLQFVSHLTVRNVIFPTLLLLVIAWGLWKWASRSRAAALTIPWLVFPLLPILNVQVFGDGNFAHNRYLYLPSVGFALLIALALRGIKSTGKNLPSIRSLPVFIGIGLAIVMGTAIQIEDRYYASDAAFYAYAYSRTGNPNPIIGMDYANTLAEQGNFRGAGEIYQKLIQAHHNMWDAYFNLGYMYYQAGQSESAVSILSKAAAGDPSNAGAVFYLGLADFKLNRLGEAEANLRRAIALAPASPNYHFALGVVLKVRGNWSQAMTEFNKELEINPNQRAAARQIAEIKKQTLRK